MSQEKFDIFISYSRKDTAIADQICAALDSAGITYFINRDEIDDKLELSSELAENIINSKLCLFLVSNNFHRSQSALQERAFAMSKKQQDRFLLYIVDNPLRPNNLSLSLINIECRYMLDFPIDTMLVDRLLEMLGREAINRVAQSSSTETKPATQLTEREKYLLNFPDDEFKWKKLGNEYGLIIYSTKELVLPYWYEDVHILGFREGLVGVKLNCKWGFLSKTLKIAIPLKYDDVGSFQEGLAKAKFKGKWGYIDKAGKEIVPFKYDEIESFEDGLAKVKLNGKYGFIDRTGQEIIPLKYDVAESFYCGRAFVRVGGFWFGKRFYIDKNGNRID